MAEQAVTYSTARIWLISATVMLATYVSVLDLTIVNVAMPQMIGTFGVSLECHHLGGSLLQHCRDRHGDHGLMVHQAVRAQAVLPVLPGPVYGRLCTQRSGALPGDDDPDPTPAGARRRCADPPWRKPSCWRFCPPKNAARPWRCSLMGVVLAPAMGPVLGGWLTDAYGLAVDLSISTFPSASSADSWCWPSFPSHRTHSAPWRVST